MALVIVVLGAVIVGAAIITRRQVRSLRRDFSAVPIESFRIADYLQASVLDLNATLLRFVVGREPSDWQKFTLNSEKLALWLGQQRPRQPPSGLLIDVTRWQSPCNALRVGRRGGRNHHSLRKKFSCRFLPLPSPTLPSLPAFAAVVKKGKTPVWTGKDAKALLDSIPKDSLSGLRDRALIAAMLRSTTAAEELSRAFQRPHGYSRRQSLPLSLHLLFLTPFVVEARRPLKEIVDSAYNRCTFIRATVFRGWTRCSILPREFVARTNI